MFEVVVAHSDDIDSEDAIAEVLATAQAELGERRPSAGLLFCGSEYDHPLLLRRIQEGFPGLQLIGCTTDGEMSSSGGYTEEAITLTLFCSQQIQIRAGVGMDAGANPRQSAHQALAQARQGLTQAAKLAIVLPDGLTASAYEVLDACRDQLGGGVPVVGGMSADRVTGSKSHYATFQFCNGEVLSDAVPVLLFGGPLRYALGVESGWRPIGERMRVTRAEGNLLQELDGRPALELYAHYLGDVMHEQLAGLGSYPLAIYEPGMERFYLRVAKDADPDTGHVRFLGEIPEGAEVQITQAIRDEVMEGVTQSVQKALQNYTGAQPQVALMFSCTGRKLALGSRTREEIGLAQAGLPLSMPMCGFYTFGEIGPVAEQAQARYHNTTFVTLLLGET